MYRCVRVFDAEEQREKGAQRDSADHHTFFVIFSHLQLILLFLVKRNLGSVS